MKIIQKINRKFTISIALSLIILGGAVLAFQKNSLEIENDKSADLRIFSLQSSDERLQLGGSADNEIMLSVADENAEEDGNKAEDENERELKFRESVKKMFEEIKAAFGFAGNKNINPDLEIKESQNEARVIRVPDDYKSIQLAIDSAGAGDRIEVSAGEYQENIVMKEGVSVIGASILPDLDFNPPSPPYQGGENGLTVLDGNGFGNVVSFRNGITSKTELAGFTIKNAGKSLSGVFVENSSPWIHDNTFIDNEYGIYIKGKSSPVIQKNAIQFSNKGIEVFNFEKLEDFTTNPIIVDNLIMDNKIGIDLYQSSAVINHNAISYNNHYKTYLGATYGIYLSKSSAEIANNIITDSGICELCAGVNADKESKNVVLKYNDIWNNKNNFVCFGECVMEDNNISFEPMFVDYASGSYKLSGDSPLIGKAEDGRDIGVRW